MAETILERRELYVDVSVKESQAEEIYLYQVDFFRDHSFRTQEYLFSKDTKTDGDVRQVDLPELFMEKWKLLCKEDIPTDCIATDAMMVTNYLLEPLKKKHADFFCKLEISGEKEVLHDGVSMGRVISMSVFDEETYLSEEIRRRMKERYHEHVDEIKKERQEHIFIQQTDKDSLPVLKLLITDSRYKIMKQLTLVKSMKEETMAVKLKEILSLYPEADIIVDKTSPELYQLFRNMSQFMGMQEVRIMFSMESMMLALGKHVEWTDILKVYLQYIKNQEDMRHGRFLPDRLYSVHSFYLPVRLSDVKAWRKQFAKNTVWKSGEKESYYLTAEGELKGKIIVKAGREQFVLELRKISIQRYLEKYALIRLDLENSCYPGTEDKKRINEIAACQGNERISTHSCSIELKIKNGEQTYLLTTVASENKEQLWLNNLLMIGKKKAKRGRRSLLFSAMKEQLYCVEAQDTLLEAPVIQAALVRDALFHKIEDTLAKVMKPEKGNRPLRRLKRRHKKQIKELFELYRYLVVSFAEGYESAEQTLQQRVWRQTELEIGTTGVKERLQTKFNLFF